MKFVTKIMPIESTVHNRLKINIKDQTLKQYSVTISILIFVLYEIYNKNHAYRKHTHNRLQITIKDQALKQYSVTISILMFVLYEICNKNHAYRKHTHNCLQVKLALIVRIIRSGIILSGP